MYRIKDGGKERQRLVRPVRLIIVSLISTVRAFPATPSLTLAVTKGVKQHIVRCAVLLIIILLITPLIGNQDKVSSFTLMESINLYSVADAEVSTKNPDDEFGTYATMLSGNSLDSGTWISYVRFDLSTIPGGAIIDNALLRVYASLASGSPTIEVHGILQPWIENTITYNNRPNVWFMPDASQVVSISSSWVSWDVTEMVSAWVEGAANHGLCLWGPSSGESFVRFHTREASNTPYLQISYEVTYPPEVTTTDASSITTSSAKLNGNLDSTGGLACQVWFEYGITESYVSATSPVSKSSTGSFSAVTPGLTPDTTYHFRACASNSEGTVCGSDMTFKTGEDTYPPGVTTADASSITTSSAALNGNLDSTGGLACQVWFEYGITESYVSATSPVSKSSTGSFSAVTPGLTPDTTYHFRACASNSEGTVCGSDMTFKTEKDTYPPGVSISYSPESPDTNEEVTFNAEASDDSGIKKIQIFVSGDMAHECSESPCIYVGGPYPEGTVNYSAKAWDTEDNMAITEDKSFNVEPVLLETECPRWDINEDCIVDYLDLAVLSRYYDEAVQSPYPRWDINEDGTAELRDLSLLAAHFMVIVCECTEDMKKEIEKIPSVLHPQLQNLPWQ